LIFGPALATVLPVRDVAGHGRPHREILPKLSAKARFFRNIVEIRMTDDMFDYAKLAFDHAPVGLVVTENRVIRACNPSFSEMFGYRIDELVDQSFAFLYPSQEEFVRIRDVGVEPLRKDNRYSDERIMARKDGTLFWCRVRGHSLTRDDDPLGRAVWSFADLSSTRQVLALSVRERQIVMHLGEGRTSKEIARMLDVSPRTVEAYRARLLKKCGAVNVAELLSHMSTMPH
jgi:PAS domain S-box-containing protein